MVGHYHVLLAAPCTEREPICVISLQLAVMEDAHMEFVCDHTVRRGCGFIQGRWNWPLRAVACTFKLALDILRVHVGVGVARLLRFCARGSRRLAFLNQVAFDCLVFGGAKAGKEAELPALITLSHVLLTGYPVAPRK